MTKYLYILTAVILCSCTSKIEQEIIDITTGQQQEDKPAVVAFKAKAIAPFMYEFTNYSTGCTSYKWDFGDGTWSNGTNATHEYDATGTYTVTLTGTAKDGAHDYTTNIIVSQPRIYIAGYTLYKIPYENRYYKVVFKDDALLPSSWDFQTTYTPMLTAADLPYTVRLETLREMVNYQSHEYYIIQVIRNTTTFGSSGEVSCIKAKLKVSDILQYKPEYVFRTETDATAIGIHMQYDY